MAPLRRIVHGLRALFARKTVERELDEELRACLEEAADAKIAGGAGREAARRAARLEVGNLEAAKDQVRDAGWESIVLTSWQDIRYALRLLRKTPGFAVAAILTLGLGIGGTTAVFSVVDALFLRAPDGVRAPASVRRVFVKRNAGELQSGDGTGNIWLDARSTRQGSRAFARMAAYELPTLVDLGRGESAAQVRASVVSQDFFPVLGIQPALGRLFLADDDGAPGAHPVVVLSHAMWLSRFGGARDVLGRSLLINGWPVQVIGVTQRGFEGIDSDAVDVWIPAAMASALGLEPEDGWQDEITLSGLTRLVARLWSPHDDARAAAAASAALAHAAQAMPGVELDPTPEVLLEPIVLAGFPGRSWAADLSVWLLFAAAFVLVIACANIASLLLARGLTRRRELAMRLSLGATRWRIVRQQMTESGVLGLLGGSSGVLFAWLGMGMLRQFPLPPSAGRLDGRLLAFSLGLSLLTALACGVLPALRTTRIAPVQVLKGARAPGGPGRNRTRLTLVAVQVSLSFTLLVGAALFVRSLDRVAAIQPGVDLHQLLTVDVNLPAVGNGNGPSRAAEFFELARTRLASLPGVERTAIVHEPPLSGWGWSLFWRLPGRERFQNTRTYLNLIGPGYFETAGTRLLRGRSIHATDTSGTEPVAVVNDAMARLLADDGNALGVCVSIIDPMVRGRRPCVRVVGVVESQRNRYLKDERVPTIYRAESQAPNAIARSSPMLLVRTRESADAHRSAVHAALQSLRADLPYVRVQSLTERLSDELRPFQLGATLFTVFAVLALALAAVGLYGLLGYFVAERTQEVGIRRALGAPANAVARLIVRQGLTPVGAGLLIGVICAFAVTRLLASRLFGIGPHDPASFAGAALFLVLVAALATFVPAWRAIRIDPMDALRHD